MAGKAAKISLTFIVIVLVMAGAATFLANSIWGRMHEPYKGYEGSEQFVEIPAGSGAADIRRRLLDSGVVPDDLTLRAALWWSGRSRSLKAGEYHFDQPITPLAVVEKIANGDIYARRITFPEGLTIQDMAAIYESHGFGPSKEFVAAAGDGSLIHDLDPMAKDLEGYLFPETYALPRTAPARQLVQLMVERFRSIYGDVLKDKTPPEGLTLRQVVTLASLVEKETGKAEERAIVAAVYANRIKRGMGMQADPTVVYALVKAGRYDGNIRKADLNIDSPYNTYRYPGLPPGPIASPGRASLDAALAPSDVPYLYFVSKNDGSHVFAETLAQHNANVQKYQVEYFRKARAEQRPTEAPRRGTRK